MIRSRTARLHKPPLSAELFERVAEGILRSEETPKGVSSLNNKRKTKL